MSTTTGDSNGASPRELREGLVGEDGEEALPPSFVKDELKTMVGIGWPMLVSYFCRFGMASEDSAFVGHLSSNRARLGAISSLGQGVAGNGFVSFLGTGLVGYGFLASAAPSSGYGPAEFLAAAGLADMVTNIIIIPPLAFNMSLNALVSQAMGAGKKKMAGTWLQLSLISLTLGYLPVLIPFFFVSPMLHLLGFEEEICELAGSYAKFNVFWPIPNGWYQCMRFFFQAQKITKPAMYNNLIFLLVNALLNWIFVFGGPFRAWLGWEGFGFVGAAVSLSLSRSMQPLAYWLYMFVFRQAHLETWPSWSERTFMKKEHVKSFLAMSVPQIGTLIFQAVVGQAITLLMAQLGKVAISAGSAVSAATMVLTGGLSPALSMVACIRVGYYLGKGQPVCAKRVSMLSLIAGVAVTAMLGLLALPFAHPLISIVTDDPEVEAPAVSILPAVMLNTVASMVVSIGTQGILTSQGRTKVVTFLSMGFELPFSIGSVAILVYLGWGLQPIYWAQTVVSLLEALVILAIVQRSDWTAFARDAQRRQGQQSAGGDGESRRGQDGHPPHNASEISMQEEGVGSAAETAPRGD